MKKVYYSINLFLYFFINLFYQFIELNPDDYDRYEENPISKQLYECGGYYRSYVGKN